MVDFTGTWKNQNESTLELRELPGGSISGRFESGVGDDGQTTWVDVVGVSQGDLIGFSASYEVYGTIVSWTGQHTEENGAGKIKCFWTHVTNIADDQEPDWMWYSNRIGFDEFVRS